MAADRPNGLSQSAHRQSFALTAGRTEKENLQLARVGIKFANHLELETAALEASRLNKWAAGRVQLLHPAGRVLSPSRMQNKMGVKLPLHALNSSTACLRPPP